MKRTFTTLLLAFTLSLSLQAQDPSLAFANPDIDTLSVAPNEFEHYVYFNLVNITESDIDVSANRFQNDLQPGQGSFFCWDLCYDTVQDVANAPITIGAGDTTQFAQYLVLKPNGVEGFASVHMIFTDVNSGLPVQRIYEFQVGDATTSVRALSPADAYLSDPYPNPSEGHSRLRYRLPQGVAQAELQVLDLLGRQVASLPLSQSVGETTVDLSQAQQGVYFLRLMAQGEALLSRKLMLN
jgi:hypothetical protein